MKIVHIETKELVKKTKEELEKDCYAPGTLVSEYKQVSLKEPVYVVEMNAKEIQLVSFYLELENRKPIINVSIDTEIKKENKKYE